MDFTDSPPDPIGMMLVKTPSPYKPSRGEVPNQKATYLAAKHDRLSRAIHVSNNVVCALFDPPGQLESCVASSSTCSISSSNKCNSEGAAGQGLYRLRSASEVHQRDNSLHHVCTFMPVSGVGSCASFTKGARASTAAAGATQAKSKKASKRGGTAAATADALQKPRPCKKQATVEAWTGQRKDAAKKNLAKLFENEE
ncbi:hypothetical protein COCOBI_08-2300 [Coccomyxa sp. Obi]|nr:hypothetical protein COCOBI_08-2300 [Coccomyxa sp. Obi]